MDYYTDVMQALIAISPVPVIFGTTRAGTDGNYYWKEKRITIRSSLSPPVTIHVLLHELAHALTWDPSMTHDIAELVAEGSALLLMEWLRIPVESYLYLLRYNSSMELPEFHQHSDIIQKTARYIIENLKERGIQPCTIASNKP